MKFTGWSINSWWLKLLSREIAIHACNHPRWPYQERERERERGYIHSCMQYQPRDRIIAILIIIRESRDAIKVTGWRHRRKNVLRLVKYSKGEQSLQKREHFRATFFQPFVRTDGWKKGHLCDSNVQMIATSLLDTLSATSTKFGTHFGTSVARRTKSLCFMLWYLPYFCYLWERNKLTSWNCRIEKIIPL